MQRITIKHLGPIQELEMDVERFNLVISEQATGKRQKGSDPLTKFF